MVLSPTKWDTHRNQELSNPLMMSLFTGVDNKGQSGTIGERRACFPMPASCWSRQPDRIPGFQMSWLFPDLLSVPNTRARGNIGIDCKSVCKPVIWFDLIWLDFYFNSDEV